MSASGPLLEVRLCAGAHIARMATFPPLRESTMERLARELEALASEAGNVVLDLEAIEYLQGAHIGRIVVLWRRLRDKGGQLVLCGMTPLVREYFTILRLDRVLTIVATVEEALASLRQIASFA